MTDQWKWWKDALGGTRGPINGNDPESGFYETRSKNRQTGEESKGVVAYWRDALGVLWCKDGKFPAINMNVNSRDELRARERWPFASKRPIHKAAYDEFIKTGKFLGQNEVAQQDRNAVTSANDPRNATDALDVDSFDGVKDRIDNLAREAERLIALGAAKTQEQSDDASDLSDRLRKLESLADDLRDKEKRPHMDAATAVQRKWAPLMLMAGDRKARLKSIVVTPFLVALRDKAIADQAAAIRSNEEVTQIAPMRPTAGTTRTTGLRTDRSATITDYPKALAYFANNEKVRDLIQQLANAAVKQGTTPDGCEIHKEEKAA